MDATERGHRGESVGDRGETEGDFTDNSTVKQNIFSLLQLRIEVLYEKQNFKFVHPHWICEYIPGLITNEYM